MIMKSTEPVRIGIVGTGYAAKLRLETFGGDRRSRVVAVAGHDLARTSAFCDPYGVTPLADWQELVQRDDIDLVVICTVNQAHGAIARLALQSGKHVVVEYPLALDPAEAETLLALAQTQRCLLHVEQIDLLSGVHPAIAQELPTLGHPLYLRYVSLNPQRPAPRKWTYHPESFGFPLVGALSRIHRLTALFGTVEVVQGQYQAWYGDAIRAADGYYTTCLCSAQLRFNNGLRAEVIYGKGEGIWQAERRFDLHAEQGGLQFEGTQGRRITPEGDRPLDGGSRRGLFAKDTQAVLDYLTQGTPLYIDPRSSLYALQVADAIRQSALSGQSITLPVKELPED